jgi:hypothetical protein
MPSSFSPSLRLELIAPGEQAGTWGTTTNTNFGTLVESSVAGYQTISVISANQALTIADGAADQSRSAMLRFTTTTGAPFNVYAPPVSKQYLIVNDAVHAVTVFNSTVAGNTTAAGTGITVPAGKSMAVFSNGTNFRTIDAAALLATLPVASGGTGATTAAGARTNLGTVNDPGGNGILVRTAENTTTPRAVAVSGTGLSVTNGDGVAGNPTVTSNATNANTPSTIVSRDASGNFSAGTISAALTGNASTATALQTARLIGGVSFNGTADINLPGVNTTGNQNTTGSAATLTTTRTLWGQNFNGSADVTGALSSVTTLAMSGQLTNTVATGTAPLVVSSTTRVANLSVANAGTADTLTTARTINGVSFNGSANITVTANTTNTLTRGTYLTGNNFNGSAATTWAVDATSTNTADKVVARDASGNFSAGTITATLSGNVTGNAATATALQNARTIGGVSFNGTANINLPGVNTAGNQNTTGTAANITGTAAVANGGTGRTTLTSNNVVLGAGTSAVNFVAPGTSGNVLTSNGTTWTSAAAATPTIATTAEAQAGTNNTNVMTSLRTREAFNASGSAPVFAARAWVNFDGNSGGAGVRSSGNVSSVTGFGTGNYTVNFTTAMPDANYSAPVSGASLTSQTTMGISGCASTDYTTTSVRIICSTSSGSGLENFALISLAVLR